MKFISSGAMDFQKRIAQKSNISFGNFIILTTEMQYFDFEVLGISSGVDIQGQDFYLQKLTHISGDNSEQFQDYLLLDDTYKQTGYFESYTFASEIDAGIYRIRAGSYYSLDLVKAIDIGSEVIASGFIIGDANGDYFGDANGDYFGEKI